MNRHLDEQEMAAAVAGLDLDAGSREHLASCLSCHASVTKMRDLIASRRAQMASPEPDWAAQQDRILRRLADAGAARVVQPRRWRTAVLAIAAVAVLAVGIALFLPSPPEVAELGAGELELERVLAEVDALLADDAIPGLWPADPMGDTDELDALFANPTS